MMLKIAGAVLILISSCLASYHLTKDMKDRKIELEQLKKMFEKMRVDALNNMNDISDCMQVSISELDFKTKPRFQNLLDKLKNAQYTNLFEPWQSTKTDMSPLKPKDEEIIDSFFKDTQGFSVSTFVEKAEQTEEKIAQNLENINENYEKNKKLYYNICVCTGILTIILLI